MGGVTIIFWDFPLLISLAAMHHGGLQSRIGNARVRLTLHAASIASVRMVLLCWPWPWPKTGGILQIKVFIWDLFPRNSKWGDKNRPWSELFQTIGSSGSCFSMQGKFETLFVYNTRKKSYLNCRHQGKGNSPLQFLQISYMGCRKEGREVKL